MAGDLPEAFLGDRSVPLQPLSHAFDPTGPTLQQRWPCSAAPAGLLIFTLPLTAPSSPLACTPLFSNPHLKRQCGGFYIINLPLPTTICTDRSNDRERESESERSGSVHLGWIQGGGRANSIKSVCEGLSWVKHLLQRFGLWPSPCWRYVSLPLSLQVFVRVCLCMSLRANVRATVPKYICFSASCQSEATFFCTPTVACGTVIFVNATLVTFRKSPERSEPNKHRHGWFRLFFTLFSGHS